MNRIEEVYFSWRFAKIDADDPTPPTGGCTNGDLSSVLCDALDQLAAADRYARNLKCDRWEFAVEIRRLLNLGVTTSDLRWLAKKGLIEHALEVTNSDDQSRRFQKPLNLSFSNKSCFILAAAIDSLDQPTAPVAAPPPIATSNSAVPNWDAEDRTLHFRGQVIKEFRVLSPNQEAVLAVFQEEGWPHYIDDPLSPVGDQNPKQRLRDTIRCLNSNQRNHLIRFRGDGTGERIRWESIE